MDSYKINIGHIWNYQKACKNPIHLCNFYFFNKSLFLQPFQKNYYFWISRILIFEKIKSLMTILWWHTKDYNGE
jgi:hypothetical protein